MEERLDFRVYFMVADALDQGARCPIGRIGLILCFPLLEMFFCAGVQPGPTLRLSADAATPRFWRQPGTETFLGLTQLAVQRVGAKSVEHAVGHFFRIEQGVS